VGESLKIYAQKAIETFTHLSCLYRQNIFCDR